MNKALDREAAVRDLLRAAALLRLIADRRERLAEAVLREMERRLLLLAEQLEGEE
jgi:hypothetical protein